MSLSLRVRWASRWIRASISCSADFSFLAKVEGKRLRVQSLLVPPPTVWSVPDGRGGDARFSMLT